MIKNNLLKKVKKLKKSFKKNKIYNLIKMTKMKIKAVCKTFKMLFQKREQTKQRKLILLNQLNHSNQNLNLRYENQIQKNQAIKVI